MQLVLKQAAIAQLTSLAEKALFKLDAKLVTVFALFDSLTGIGGCKRGFRLQGGDQGALDEVVFAARKQWRRECLVHGKGWQSGFVV